MNMELQEFIKNVAEQFDDTETSNFSAKTEFKELEEWSSLVSLSLIAMVDEEYAIQLKGEDIRNSRTIEDLFNLISLKNNK